MRDRRHVDDEAAGLRAFRDTPGPNRTASTSGVSETMVMTMSLAAATAAGLSPSLTPSSLELAGRPASGSRR
jgi:acetyl-CoA acetyltransferase